MLLPSRRRFLTSAAMVGAASILPGPLRALAKGHKPRKSRLAPVLFVSHGTPAAVLLDDDYGRALRKFATGVKPHAVLVVSNHFRAREPIKLVSPPLHKVAEGKDCPPELRAINYGCRGLPKLAIETQAVLWRVRVPSLPEPGVPLDYGSWAPLRFMFPRPTVPVIAASLPPDVSPEELARLGAAFVPLRERGVMIVASGGLSYNAEKASTQADAAVTPAAKAFDDWMAHHLAQRDDRAIFGYRKQAPQLTEALPRTDHLDPLFFALGVTHGHEKPTTVFEGFRFGTVSMRTMVFGT